MTKSLNKSLVTFIRKELGFPGKSEHSGRGFTEMSSTRELSYSEIREKVESLLPKWRKKHLVVKAEITDEGLSILFAKTVFDPYYARFAVTAEQTKFWKYLVGQVTFTSPRR